MILGGFFIVLGGAICSGVVEVLGIVPRGASKIPGRVIEKHSKIISLVGFEEIVDDDEVGVFFEGEGSDFFGFAGAEEGFGGGSAAFLEDFYDDDTAVGFDKMAEFVEVSKFANFIRSFRDDVDEDSAHRGIWYLVFGKFKGS